LISEIFKTKFSYTSYYRHFVLEAANLNFLVKSFTFFVNVVGILQTYRNNFIVA